MCVCVCVCVYVCVQAVHPLMMESNLDEETEKTLLHLVASLLLVSTAAEIETLFIVDDVRTMTANS